SGADVDADAAGARFPAVVGSVRGALAVAEHTLGGGGEAERREGLVEDEGAGRAQPSAENFEARVREDEPRGWHAFHDARRPVERPILVRERDRLRRAEAVD